MSNRNIKPVVLQQAATIPPIAWHTGIVLSYLSGAGSVKLLQNITYTQVLRTSTSAKYRINFQWVATVSAAQGVLKLIIPSGKYVNANCSMVNLINNTPPDNCFIYPVNAAQLNVSFRNNVLGILTGFIDLELKG